MRTMKFKFSVFICGIIFAAIIFMVSPYFYINEIETEGFENFTLEEVLSVSEIIGTTNIFLFNTREARQNILKNLYINDVTFDKTLPGTLKIKVKERHVCGYVEYMQGQYLYIDEHGRVLEINSSFKGNYPIVSGLKFNRFVLGERLEVENNAAFQSVMQFAWLFINHGIADHVSSIDVSDSDNTKIHIYNIEYNVGDGRNADEKMRTIIEIITKLPHAEVIRGFVDIKEIREEYVLKIVR